MAVPGYKHREEQKAVDRVLEFKARCEEDLDHFEEEKRRQSWAGWLFRGQRDSTGQKLVVQ